MNSPFIIPNAPLEHPAMDYAFLRQEGIRHLERMAGKLWTDYNLHDPGITILEQICYAITDLGYRIAYELPDLLATNGGDPYESLYSPARILTSHPVTLTDLRRLVLDVEGVKNVWIEKVEEPDILLHYHAGKNELSLQEEPLASEPVYLKGLYRVLIEKSDLTDIDGTVVQREVARRLHACRNLCEDFEEIRVLEPQNIQIQARVEIGPVDDAEGVLLMIYEKISDYLSPRIPFATLDEMLEASKPVDEIFDGPMLEHGFIDAEALARVSRRTTIYTSDLIHAIMDVPGLRAVRNINVSAGEMREAWSLELDPDRTPKLDVHASEITLEREQLTVSVDVKRVIEGYSERRRRSTAFQKLTLKERDLAPPIGRDRSVGNYYSIQHQFPACYGIGEMGLPASATAQRKAQAKQLKAYLMFFDQLLANYFAQLAHMKDLFSFYEEDMRTYFSQPIEDSGLGLDEIRVSGPDGHAAKLQEIVERSSGSGTSLQRKNRFLNHLMARFAEQFTDYSLILFGIMPKGISPAEKLVYDKQAFLQQYLRISSARGTAFNYLKPWSQDNISGLEKRIRLKLGLIEEQGEDFYVVEHILLRPMEDDAQQQIPLLAAAGTKDPYSLQLSFVFPEDWPARFKLPEDENKKAKFRGFIEQTVREETPAHLTPYIHWLDKDAVTKFKSTYQDWLEKRCSYWSDKLGLQGSGLGGQGPGVGG